MLAQFRETTDDQQPLVRGRGIDYLLLFDGQVAADDFRVNADLWGATFVGSYKEARLYDLR